jgi:hypothetical protein
MPIRVADLAKERSEVVVNTPLGQVRVTYRPNVRTPADEARMANATGEDAYREMLESLHKLIVEWDLVGPVYDAEDGSLVIEEDAEVPTKPQITQHISSTLLGMIFTAMLEDMRPNSPKNPSKNSQKLYATDSRGSLA